MFRLHTAQQAFCNSNALYRAFCGGRGAGKSYAGAVDMHKRAGERSGLYMVCAPSYPMLQDSSLRSFLEGGRQLGDIKDVNRSKLNVTLTNGSEVIFRSADDPERLRGPNLSGAWLDEASLMHQSAYLITIACLREGGKQGWLSATFTPRGRQHWTFSIFGEPDPTGATELFHAKTTDNPFLPPTFADAIRRQYTSNMADQELSGLFTDLEGALFHRNWFPIVDTVPKVLRCVRFWDLAATAPAPGKDPDWTAGVLMGRDDNTGDIFILDVKRAQASAQHVQALVRQTAESDGTSVAIVMEQEPGSSGVAVIDYYRRQVLSGFDFHGERSTGDKVTRARPLAAQAEAGVVKLRRGSWNKDFLDEVEVFPFGSHDDQVDGASGAFGKVGLCPWASVPDADEMAAAWEESARVLRATSAQKRFEAGLSAAGRVVDDDDEDDIGWTFQSSASGRRGGSGRGYLGRG
jgi:predicted phage terminase large subunit-like protein